MLEMISPFLPYCSEPVNQTYQLRVSTFGRAVRHNQAEPCKHRDAAVLQLCLPLHVFASSVRQRKMGESRSTAASGGTFRKKSIM